jgi:hypothetical protein
MDSPKTSLFGETIRHFDDLMAEARHLRERIVALQREREPSSPNAAPITNATNPTAVARENLSDSPEPRES